MKWTVSIGALLVLVFIPNYNASEPTGEMAFLFQLTTEDDSSPGDFLLTSEDATLHPPDDRLLETTTDVDHLIDSHHKEIGHSTHRIQVFTADFLRVKVPFIIALWIFFASIAKIGFHVTPKLSQIFPESCLLILAGIFIGLMLFHVKGVHVSPLTPTTFFLYMLPPIILDAGYFVPNRLFFDHLGTILLFAVIGTIWNVVSIALALWGCGQLGVFGFDLPLLDTFLFSSLISAVDPVAVLAVFEEIHVNEVLYIVVFGESLLNDAVTVVLYNMFDCYIGMGEEKIQYSDLLSGCASFAVVALGGTFIGIIWGFFTGFVSRFTNHVRVIEPIFIFVMSYLAYLNAEIFHMSGILAITFCGITMKNYVKANISSKSLTTIKYLMKMLSSSSETIIFMFLGVNTVNDQHDWDTAFILLTILFCTVFRAIGVIILAETANRFRLHKLDWVDKFIMSYGGLRGAVAFALVLLIDPKKVKNQPLFVTATLAVVFFTVFLQGITIKPLAQFLKVKRSVKHEESITELIQEKFMNYTMTGIEDILGHMGKRKFREKFRQLDDKILRPCLIRNHATHEPKILEMYSKLALKDAMKQMQAQQIICTQPNNTFLELQSDEVWKPHRKSVRRHSRYATNSHDFSDQLSQDVDMEICRIVSGTIRRQNARRNGENLSSLSRNVNTDAGHSSLPGSFVVNLNR